MAFNGTWIEYKNENFDEFLAALGVDAVRRQLARNISLHVTIKQDGERFTVFEKSKLRSKELTWTSGEEVEGEDPDGTKIKGTFTLEAPNKYVGQFQRMSDGKQIKISREVDGDEMLQLTSINDVEVRRYFKRKAE
ncbi:fatty acid-binding protein, intestinal-like [Polypterus senegalus]